MSIIDKTSPLPFSPVLNPYTLATLVFIHVLVLFSQSKRQKLLPNVLVVGVEGSTKIEEARKRFRHGSKAMLLEGYQKVFLCEIFEFHELTVKSIEEIRSMCLLRWASDWWFHPSMWRNSKMNRMNAQISRLHLWRFATQRILDHS